MPKRLIDIYPPNKFGDINADEDVLIRGSRLTQRRVTDLKRWMFAIPVLVLPLVVLHFFFADATVSVWPHITQLHIQEQIIAQVGQQNVDLGQKLIPAKIFEQEKEATKSFNSTGRDEREEKASGMIQIFNDNSAAQTLVSNTRFISEDGKIFRSQEKVLIPAAQNGKPGSIEIMVVAAESGNEYNIKPSSFSLPGLAGSALYTKVYGKSSSPMKGGAVGEVSVVTTDDIRDAKEQLLRDLEVEAKTALLSRIPPNYVVLDASMETELLQDNTLVKEGAALDNFTYTASIKVSAMVFAKEDGVLVSRHIFESYLNDEQLIKEDTFSVLYDTEASNINTGRMVLRADISADQYTKIELDEVQNRLSGVSKNEITSVLEGFPTITRAEFSLWPFWIQNLPRDREKLNMDLLL